MLDILDTGLTFFVDEISADVGVALDVNGRAQTSATGVLGMAQLVKLGDSLSTGTTPG